ncbi:acyl-CoA desaturase [Roseobacter sp. CCS2]|uniref:acyl-CoA desaturase n=1 Tax=Roseobacter sp. CCS2 TaxID=391593 RepID=UPI0002FA3C9F|nr:acyl-CoA desaturase [Roseobacter sp. CCS2]
MPALIATERVIPGPQTSAMAGYVQFLPLKALWLGVHGILGAIGVLWFMQLDAILVFVVLTAVTICCGHSVGMHRLLIHRSFRTFRGVEYVLVWLGTLVGMAGPMGMIQAHDMRDWHQRQTECPAHAAHAAGFWKDAYWQLCCAFRLDHPPTFMIEARVSEDQVFRFIERTWMLQQLPLAIGLFMLGGWAFVLWGVSLRIFVSLVGHWMVGHFAHRSGAQGWYVSGVAVQGYNLPRLGWVTFGENWHGNHHAFPHSARLGVEPGQADPGFWFIKGLVASGLAWDIALPDTQPPRDGLVRKAATSS